MEIGWIDFSKSERSKILSILDLLSEKGTLDELGIAPIRDGFANLFFPGTSTIQTKAKYFLCVPYVLKDLERSGETNPNRMLAALSAAEEKCGKIFFTQDPSAENIIGGRALKSGLWVKRPPSDIYWAGIRRYGIFVGGNMSLSEYIRFVCADNAQKSNLLSLGNSNDRDSEADYDDRDAGKDIYKRFWNLPTYTQNWQDNLSISLTADEAEFLRKQIILNCKNSMLSHVLQERITQIVAVESFEEMGGLLMSSFPAQIQSDYRYAVEFSEFVYALRIMYNIIVSDGKNEEAESEWMLIKPLLKDIASIDIETIFIRLKVSNPLLLHFLNEAKEYILSESFDALKDCIIKREVHLKGASRAKANHPGKLNTDVWYGGRRLDYRFGHAKTIINDILVGGNAYAQSEQRQT